MASTSLKQGIVLLACCFVMSFVLGWRASTVGMMDDGLLQAPLPRTTPKLTMPLSRTTPKPHQARRSSPPTTVPAPAPKRVILTTTNSAYLNFTRNWLESLRRCGVEDPVIIIAENQHAYDVLRGMNDFKFEVKYSRHAGMSGDLFKFHTPLYLQLVNKRPAYILSYLKKGIDVLFSDVDTVWLKNPMPYFKERYDVYVHMDRVFNKSGRFDDICAGFVYYSATKTTIAFIDIWLQYLRFAPEISDQWQFNTILRTHPIRQHLNISRLDYKRFISGFYYFDYKWRKKNSDIQPVTVHVNFEKSFERKIEKLKTEKLWYIVEEPEK